MPNPTPLTPALIAAHERLHSRLAALFKQVERVAARRPGQPVAGEIEKLARELCREAARLLGREGRSVAMGQAKPGGGGLDHAGLAVALGQALSGLEAFEAEHSGHSEQLGYAIWRLEGVPIPVRRLLPEGQAGGKVEPRDPEAGMHMRAVAKMIMVRFRDGYNNGYKDAMAGKPPSPATVERIWDGLMEIEARRKSEQTGQPMRIRRSNPPRHLLPKGATPSDPRSRDNF